MSDFKRVTDSLFVSPQINAADIDAAAGQGITLIVNNRPDGEEGGQPANADLAAIAESKGIKWAAIPVTPGQLSFEAVETMGFALRDAEGPVLAFCRSGTRSCTLWALSEALTQGRTTEDILTHASQAGYDLSDMVPTLEHLQKTNAG